MTQCKGTVNFVTVSFKGMKLPLAEEGKKCFSLPLLRAENDRII